jgi:demethylmenaquinone methyltransferase / 2-methoxy-6-polyprenyl-1,4-benzoquinol methylase
VGHEPFSRPDPLVPHPPLTRYYADGDARRGWVDRMFDTTARHYDWINTVMSFGSGIWYRREALKRLGVGPGAEVLDVCIGTGLVARPARDLVGAAGRVVGLDASLGMLFAAKRASSSPLVQAYVEALPLADESFDFVTMGYALRHVADLRGVFAEYRRVLRPGGRLLVLEFTRPRSRARYHLVRFYLRSVVPAVARLGGRDASTIMRYFWDTIESCVPPETIMTALADAGLGETERFVQADLFSEYRATRV